MHRARTTLPAAVAAALLLLAAGPALAQPGAYPPPPPRGYGPPPPPPSAPPPYEAGFFPRWGLTLGFGIGLGAMGSERGIVDCTGCRHEPASLGLDFHIGGMLNERTALLFELWTTGQTLDGQGRAALWQTMALGALQYWATPQLWLKGGIGLGHLTLLEDTGYYVLESDVDTGAALMGAVGYEILSSRHFAVDLQLRFGTGTYRNFIDDKVKVGAIGLGMSWY